MNKPEHISEGVWDAADAIIRLCEAWHQNADARSTVQNSIATALMEARAEEREGCASLVENTAIAKSSHAEPALVPRKFPSQSSTLLAQAIRERNDK